MDFILKVSNNVFFINTSLDELTARLFKEKDSRPLIKSFQSKDILKEFVAKHLFERIVYYKRSNHTIKDENKSLDDLCNEIISKTSLKKFKLKTIYWIVTKKNPFSYSGIKSAISEFILEH